MGSEGRRLDPLADAFAGSAESYDRARPGYEDEPVVEASEEAVLNSLFTAPTVVGRAGNTSTGIPVADVVELLRAHGSVDA
jgi:hypothetical protein